MDSAPEKNEAHFLEAKHYLEQLTFDKNIKVIDVYGSAVAEIYVKDQNISDLIRKNK